MDLLPGSKLGVGEIADQLGVSRSPVRDAFHMLMAEGLIVPGAANSYRVIEFSRKYIQDVFVVRRTLELLAVRLSTENLDRPRIEKLRETWQQLREAREDDSQLIETHHNADTDLHHTLCEMGANAVLLETMDRIIPRAALIRRWVFSSGVTHSYLVTLAEEHLGILDAVLAGDAEKAAAKMHQHLVLGQERAFKRLDSR
jgi:DNA-binding GntR family transcriptional regulator